MTHFLHSHGTDLQLSFSGSYTTSKKPPNKPTVKPSQINHLPKDTAGDIHFNSSRRFRAGLAEKKTFQFDIPLMRGSPSYRRCSTDGHIGYSVMECRGRCNRP
ncbi:hypothetical protein JTE90_024461 [Oedothorax gibbosus]|uniref:Uncharacterized protein n=1 Tax=Oedothorax gibbosus TaxID=931172 RepID=A0AAV6UIS9_9ARAC|nr:hypothetical protein JTE90_024461 [Oedothorax gibbosus]